MLVVLLNLSRTPAVQSHEDEAERSNTTLTVIPMTIKKTIRSKVAVSVFSDHAEETVGQYERLVPRYNTIDQYTWRTSLT